MIKETPKVNEPSPSKMPDTIAAPASTCVYEEYDPTTLLPKNEQTRIRLAELGWERSTFEGKTVLDIGCNSGILSLEAWRLGATHVLSCDVQAPLVEFFSNVVNRKKLPIEVRKLPLDKLDPVKDGADVVLFMEVLHWAVAQGTPMPAVIRKIIELTRETLYIEFPWAADEPSIKAQTKLTDADYSAHVAIDLLARHFEDVRLVRFMSYFGFSSPSKRVLIRASRKRAISPVLFKLPDARPIDVTLPHGRNSNSIAYSPRGTIFIKQVSAAQSISRVDSKELTKFFDRLAAGKARALVQPVRIDAEYLHQAGKTGFMVLPLIGGLTGGRIVQGKNLSTDELLKFLLALRRDIRAAEGNLPQAFLAAGCRPVSLPAKDHALWSLPVLTDRVRPIMERLASTYEAGLKSGQADAIQHGDIQTGNLLRQDDGELIAIDLDSLSPGTPYSDGLLALTWRGASFDDFSSFAAENSQNERRPMTDFDVAFSAVQGLTWLNTVLGGNLASANSQVVTLFMKGFESLVQLTTKQS
jgi:SAM-dependent methyltransferase